MRFSASARLWHAADHDVTFAARHATRPRALAAELGERAHAASVADAVAAAEVVLVAVPGPAVTGALQAVGPLDGRIVIDAANSFGQHQLSLWSLADALPQARWVRAFNSLSVNVMADDNHREPPWVLFLSGDEEVKPAAAQLIRDAGFDPVDLGGIDDSQLQDPGSRPKPSGTGHPRLCGGGCSACSSCRPMTWRRCWHGWNPVADILQAADRGVALTASPWVQVPAEPGRPVSAVDWCRRCGERGRTAVSVGEDGQLVNQDH